MLLLCGWFRFSFFSDHFWHIVSLCNHRNIGIKGLHSARKLVDNYRSPYLNFQLITFSWLGSRGDTDIAQLWANDFSTALKNPEIPYDLKKGNPGLSCIKKSSIWKSANFFWFVGILGSASRAEFPVSLSNHVGFTPRLLYSSTHHSPESIIQLRIGWAQDAWLRWSYENRYFHLDISRWLMPIF